jgi:hypothetical protein
MVKVTWHGDAIEARVEAAGKRAMFVAGEVLLDEANTKVPYMDHILEASGEVTVSGPDEVIVSYDTPYAERLHENPRGTDKPFHFMHGRESHWLSKALEENSDVLQEVAARVFRGEL